MDRPPKQQVIEKLKTSNNILIVVSNNPTIDQLATAIGMTLMLNKLKKHAVAVYSGETPQVIEFLKPEDTIERNTDSLQDFIISLDRSKADKLRYKVENDVVKIFITPYRTGITEEDLQFAQGDFNVDVVVALGVDQREHLDDVIVAHGQILHDAVVTSMMAGPTTSNVGSINWQEPGVSSLAEMAVKMSDALQPGILDAQMSTAFLTGIVAETERFKNEKTSSKVMTIAAQLVASGANPQLVSESLEGLVASIIDDEQNGQIPQPDDEEQSGPTGPAADGAAQAAEIITLDTSDEVKNIQLRDNADDDQAKKIDYIHIDNNGHLSRLDDKQPNGASNEPGNEEDANDSPEPPSPPPPQPPGPPSPQPPVPPPPPPSRIVKQNMPPMMPPEPSTDSNLPPPPPPAGGLGERMRRLTGKTVTTQPKASVPPPIPQQPPVVAPPPPTSARNHPFPPSSQQPPINAVMPPAGPQVQASTGVDLSNMPPPPSKPHLDDARQQVDQAFMNREARPGPSNSQPAGNMTSPPPLLPPPPVVSHP